MIVQSRIFTVQDMKEELRKEELDERFVLYIKRVPQFIFDEICSWDEAEKNIEILKDIRKIDTICIAENKHLLASEFKHNDNLINLEECEDKDEVNIQEDFIEIFEEEYGDNDEKNDEQLTYSIGDLFDIHDSIDVHAENSTEEEEQIETDTCEVEDKQELEELEEPINVKNGRADVKEIIFHRTDNNKCPIHGDSLRQIQVVTLSRSGKKFSFMNLFCDECKHLYIEKQSEEKKVKLLNSKFVNFTVK